MPKGKKLITQGKKPVTREQENEARNQRRKKRMRPTDEPQPPPEGGGQGKKQKIEQELWTECTVFLSELPPLNNEAAAGTGGDARGGRSARCGDG